MAVVLADTNSFDALINTDFAVVDFYAYHCGVCVVLAPNFNEVSNEYPLVNFIKVNVDEGPTLCKRFHITGLPTVVCFRDGKEVYRTGYGPRTREDMEGILGKLLYGKKDPSPYAKD